MCATKLEHGAGVLPEIVDEGAPMSVEDDGSMLLSQQEYKKKKNLTVAQKKYLTEVFQGRKHTGKK